MSVRWFVPIVLGLIIGAVVLNRALPDSPGVLPMAAVVFIVTLLLIWDRARRERRGNSTP
ncbi:MAG TPA: hypothetical protein VFJ45_00685 [bacterium]|nr:hypothetical protein [bacterium]